MDSSPSAFSVHEILQARILERVGMPSSRGSSQPRDWTIISYISFIGRRVFFFFLRLSPLWSPTPYLVCAMYICSVMSDSLWAQTLCSPPDSSVHGDSPGKNTGVGYHALFQGIFPTQGSNPGLLHCKWILYCLSHQGSPHLTYWLINILIIILSYTAELYIYSTVFIALWKTEPELQVLKLFPYFF